MEQERQQELRGLFQMLEQTAEIAENALLTETYSNSEGRCISQFNKVLKRLNELNAVPNSLFDPLEDNATFSEISIACNHLAAYLSEGLGLSTNLKGMMTNLLGKKFIDNISEELKEGSIGELIRNAMPEFLTETKLDDINESFKVNSDGKLILDTDFGTIDVQTSDNDVVKVVVHRSAQLKTDRNAAEILKDFQVDFKQQNNDININAEFKEGKSYWKKTSDRLDIHFEITVPQTFQGVFLKTAGGDISVEDINGTIQSHTNTGNLQLHNTTGTLIGHTGNGNIRLTKCTGDVRVESLRGNIEIKENNGTVDATTSRGNIRCFEVDGKIIAETSGGSIKLVGCKGEVRVETLGGNIDLQNEGSVTAKTFGGSIKADILGQLNEDSILESSGGDITVSFMSDIQARVDAKSSGGKVSSELPNAKVDQTSPQKNQMHVILNADGPLLKLRSIGGDIQLKCRQ